MPNETLPPRLGEIFGVLNAVSGYIDTILTQQNTTTTRSDLITHGIVPSLAKLTNSVFQRMSNELKLTIAATITAIVQLPAADRTWTYVYKAMQQNPFLQVSEKVTVHKFESISNENQTWFTIKDDIDPAVIRQVIEHWFIELIDDPEVRETTRITTDGKIGKLAELVAQTAGTKILDWKRQRASHAEETLIDIGVLRFPDPVDAYFKLYRIKLDAWAHATTVFGLQTNNNGIRGWYDCSRFDPKPEVLALIAPHLQEKAMTYAEDLFGNNCGRIDSKPEALAQLAPQLQEETMAYAEDILRTPVQA